MPASEETNIKTSLKAENVVLYPEKEDRLSVVKALLAKLVESDDLAKSQSASALRGINEREALGSTAIGGGLAIPHARVGFLDDIIVAYALLKNGSEFNSLDGGKVRHVFLILSPKDDDKRHVTFLKSVTKFANVTTHMNALAGCKTPEDVVGVVQDYA